MPYWEYAQLLCYRGKLVPDSRQPGAHFFRYPKIFLYLPGESQQELAPVEELRSTANRDEKIVEILNDLGRQGWEVVAVETANRLFQDSTVPTSEWSYRRFWLKRPNSQ
jgi:hypothetical protein